MTDLELFMVTGFLSMFIIAVTSAAIQRVFGIGAILSGLAGFVSMTVLASVVFNLSSDSTMGARAQIMDMMISWGIAAVFITLPLLIAGSSKTKGSQ